MWPDVTDKVLDVNLKGPFRLMALVGTRMAEQGGGSIVNISSGAAHRGVPGSGHYAAAKAGVMALTRCSALEAADHGVRINAVSPSIAFHEFLKKTSPAESTRSPAAELMYQSTAWAA